MNIVQLHERVRFWVDIVASTRFDSQSIDNGINVAIDSKVRESYDQNRPMNRSDAFQRVQRVRDELGPLVKDMRNEAGLSIVVSLVPVGTPGKVIVTITDDLTDFGWLLSMRMHDDTYTEWYPVFPISHNRKDVVKRNPYRRVRVTPESKAYYYEENGGWVIDHLFPDISDVQIYYLATPAIVNYGVEYNSTKSFSEDDEIIAVEETVYDGNTYKIGEKMTVTLNPSITSGLVVFDYTECDVRKTTHEEISRRAAMNCLTAARQYDKVNELRKEITAS